jgi:hypothetical protein
MGSTLALAHPLYYDRLVQLARTIKFVHHAASALKDFPKLQDICCILITCFGEEFADCFIQLCWNCEVNPKVYLNFESFQD